jgi:hypothetical protein
MYSIVIRTEYQQQMNELLQPFITTTGGLNSFIFSYQGNRYEAFIQQDFAYNKNTSNLAEDERIFETKITIKVLGYLVGEGDNREKPKITIRETQVTVEFARERVVRQIESSPAGPEDKKSIKDKKGYLDLND